MPKPELSKSQIIRDFLTKNPTLSISEVATMLGERGTKVSKNLVYVVKGKMKAKKHKEQREKAEAKAAASNNAPSDVNKSEEIRQILRANRKMKAMDVVTALADKGIEVTANQVYYVLGELRGRKKKAKKMVAQVAVATESTSVDAVKTILKVKSWAQEVGGLKKLKALVDALSE